MRKAKEAEIKKLDSEIQNLKSAIDKSKDDLLIYESHKKFLTIISPPNDIADLERIKQAKKAKIKKEWIELHKGDTRDDHIIFRDDDDVFADTMKG